MLKVASSPHLLIPCSLTDQNFANNFEKDHSRNIAMKLFQTLTSTVREEHFSGNSCLNSESIPHSPEPC